MSTNPIDIPDPADDATAAALGRMRAAREQVRRHYFSPEAMGGPFPVDAPEVIGIHAPDVMREHGKRAAG